MLDRPQPGCEPGDEQVLGRGMTIDPALIPRSWALAQQWHALRVKRTSMRTARYLAPSTVDGQQRQLRVWLRFLADQGVGDRIDDDVVRRFRVHLARRPAASANAILDTVRTFARWAAQHGMPPIANALRRIPAAAMEGDTPTATLNRGQIRQLLRAVDASTLRGLRTKACITVLASCPVDTMALTRARIGALNLRSGTIDLVERWSITKTRRGRREQATTRYVLPDRAKRALRRYLEARRNDHGVHRHEPTNPLFASLRNDRETVTPLALRLDTLRALVAAGLRAPTPGIAKHDASNQYPRIVPADLRHLDGRLASDPSQAMRVRALLHALATGAAVRWDRLRTDGAACTPSGLVITRSTAHGGRAQTVVPLTDDDRAVFTAWCSHQTETGATFLFGVGDALVSHHTLKRLAWGAFPERLPRGTPTRSQASTRLIQPPVDAHDLH